MTLTWPDSARILDLFAGPGGWDEGLKALGRFDVLGIDNDASACATAESAGHLRRCEDVADTTTSDLYSARYTIDGLIASPPCPGFSKAGGGAGLRDFELLTLSMRAISRFYDPRPVIRSQQNDPRSVLTVEPLRYALALRPEWIALEQVPGVLPLWQVCADVLNMHGYDARAEIVYAECYGVPQTRRRAVLRAVYGRELPPMTPTHSKYYPRDAKRLDAGMLPWVSMAEALGWGVSDQVGFPRRADRVDVIDIDGTKYRARDFRDASRPSFTLTEKARSMTRLIDREAVAAIVLPRYNDQSKTPFDPAWPADQPAPTIAGREIVTAPGANANRYNGKTKSRNDGVRVSVTEAGALQSFRADYPWTGNRTAQFQQVGDAVPPLLASAVLSTVIGG